MIEQGKKIILSPCAHKRIGTGQHAVHER
jgi:hypothetical protein